MAKRVIRIIDLASTRDKPGLVPVSPATWWRWVKEGKAPQPFKLGANTTVWSLEELDAWLMKQSAGGAQ